LSQDSIRDRQTGTAFSIVDYCILLAQVLHSCLSARNGGISVDVSTMPHTTALRRLGRACLATLILGLGGLGAVTSASLSSADAGFLPIVESFTDIEANNAWTALGTAHLTGSGLELTPFGGGNGMYVLEAPISSANGVQAEFDVETNGGADGTTFFLMDGSVTPALGYGGGAFGYMGMPAGYLAVALDEYHQQMKLIGSGDGATGYALLGNTYVPVGGTQRVRFRLLNGVARVELKNIDGSWRKMFDTPIDGFASQAPLPEAIRVGFSAATGGVTARHLVRNVEISEPGLEITSTVSKDLTNGVITLKSRIENLTARTFNQVTVTATGVNATVPALADSCEVLGSILCDDGDTFAAITPEIWYLTTRRAVAPTAASGAMVTSTVSSLGNANVSSTISIDAGAFPTIDFPRRTASTSQESIVIRPRAASSGSVVITSAYAENGSVDVLGDQTLEYFPDSEFTGVDTITYRLTAGDYETRGNTLEVTMVGPNEPPTATFGTVTFAEDGPSFALPITLSDPDDDAVTITDAWADYGDVEISEDGSEITYTPDSDFNGEESIWISYSDGIYDVDTDGPTFTFDITPVDDAPRVDIDTERWVWEDDGDYWFWYRAYDPDAGVVIEPDVDAFFRPGGGADVPLASVTAAHGTVVLDTEESFLAYEPNPDFFGTDTLTFVFDDGAVPPNTATAEITVIGTPDNPTASATAVVINANTAVDIPVTLADVDGDAVTIVEASAESGTVTIVGSTLHYVPATNASGTDTITYGITDGVGNDDYDYIVLDGDGDNSVDVEYEVVVTINPVDGRPTATASDATTPEDTAVDIDVTISDLDSTTGLSISAATALHGTVTISGTTLRYTPAKDYNGTDTITYSVTDGTHITVGNTVGVAITPVNDAPTPRSGDSSTLTGTSSGGATVSFDIDNIDVDGDGVDVVLMVEPKYGTATLKPNPTALAIGTAGGSIVYTPNPGFAGTDTFSYSVSDGQGGSYVRVVEVTVVASRLVAGALPTTGSDTSGVLGAGALALLLGVAMVTGNRRRKVAIASKM
jgi:LPXTG-motif cell wall-anchored protein